MPTGVLLLLMKVQCADVSSVCSRRCPVMHTGTVQRFRVYLYTAHDTSHLVADVTAYFGDPSTAVPLTVTQSGTRLVGFVPNSATGGAVDVVIGSPTFGTIGYLPGMFYFLDMYN